MNKRLKNVLLYCMAIGTFAIAFYNPIRRQREIDLHKRFTVGTIYKQTSSLKNGERYHYHYAVNNKEYEANNSKARNYPVYFGDIFIVEFSSRDPEIARILYEWPVTVNLDSFPSRRLVENTGLD